MAVNKSFETGAVPTACADLQQPTNTPSGDDLEMDETNTTDGPLGKTKFRIWLSAFFLLIIIGSLLLITNIGIAMYCLYDQGYTTAICSLKRKSLRILRIIAETTEPVVSTVIVVLAMVLTYKSRENRNGCCAHGFTRKKMCPKLISIFKKRYWFTTYCFMVFFSFIYHIAIFIFDVMKRLEGSFRYLTLPFGLTSWFVWLVALNKSGAMTTGLKKSYSENQVSRLHCLYGALLIFAGITNFTEFLIYTIYLTANLTTVESSLKLKTYVDFMGMTLTVALRYSLASYFFQMFYVGKSNYKLLNDPWTEGKQ